MTYLLLELRALRKNAPTRCEGADLKRIMRTGTVASKVDRKVVNADLTIG